MDMKRFIIVAKIARAGIVSRAARIAGTAVELRQARSGRHVGDGTRRDTVASISQPKAQRHLTEWLDGFVRYGGERPHLSRDQNKLTTDGNFEIRSAAVEALNQKPEIELPG